MQRFWDFECSDLHDLGCSEAIRSHSFVLDMSEQKTSSPKLLNIEHLGFPWKTQDPFLFCAYHRDEYPAGNVHLGIDHSLLTGREIGQDFVVKDGWRMYHGHSIPGFPYHPHRGFETITINKEGVVDHSDSLGASGRFMGGDVQWMTAGAGIQHSEMFPMLNADAPNPLEIFQIWLNLPRRSKLVNPHFKMLWKADIPVREISDAQGKTTTIDVVAGSFDGMLSARPTPDSWAADPANAVGIYTVKMEPNAEWILPQTIPDATRSLFFYKGSTLLIDGIGVPVDSNIIAVADAELTIQNGNAEGFMLILEGKPIGEPVVQHGPFVMNTSEEIRETMREYGRTQFGGWPWQEKEVVHDPLLGRFARHADGKEELK